MNIPASILEPFGYTGIPTMTVPYDIELEDQISVYVDRYMSKTDEAHEFPLTRKELIQLIDKWGIMLEKAVISKGALSARFSRTGSHEGATLIKLGFSVDNIHHVQFHKFI